MLTLLAAWLAFGGVLFDRIQVDPGQARAAAGEPAGRDATALFHTELEDPPLPRHGQ